MKRRVAALLLALLLALPAGAVDYESQGKDYSTVGGTIQALVPLEGELMRNIELVSVVLPATVDIVVRVYDDGRFRQLYAPSNLSVLSSSDVPVDLSLVEVKDEGGRLAAFDAILKAYSLDGRNTLLYDGSAAPLAPGPCSIPIGRLAPVGPDGLPAPGGGLRLGLEGRANASDGPVGAVGDRFAFATTFKVTAPPPAAP